jgi:hypothetical protein
VRGSKALGGRGSPAVTIALVLTPILQLRHLAVRSVALAVLAAVVSPFGLESGRAATAPTATLRDPVGDVRAGDIDLTAIALAKQNGNLVVRFTVRRPITNDVSYTASVRSGAGSWALVARRGGGDDAFLLYDLSQGTTTAVTGVIKGRTATVTAPIASMVGPDGRSLGRVSAYFRADLVRNRSGASDRAATTGPTVWFCLTDRRPRPKWGPCIWPGETR